VPELVITTPVAAPFQMMVAVLEVERSVPPLATVPVSVPATVLAVVSVAPDVTVKVAASAASGATSADMPTTIANRLAPLRHFDIHQTPSPKNHGLNRFVG
jgi:hypothetical protein